MNLEDNLGHFDINMSTFICIKSHIHLFLTNRKYSPDHQLIGHFGKKSLFFRDTRKVQEHYAKVRLSISLTSPENSVAEIIPLKENRPK